MARQITYTPSETCAAFHNSPKNIRGIRGPVGSGKSVACCMEIFFASMRQIPSDDGVFRNRWLILRNTYKELLKTTVKTWMTWFPDTKMHNSAPLSGVLCLPHVDGSGRKVEIELEFWSMEENGSEESLKSLEITGVWANEASQMDWKKLCVAYERCGRYPSKKDGVSFISHGMIMDTNSPDDSNWWYKLSEIKKPQSIAFFDQPPALIRKEDKASGTVWYEPNKGQVSGVKAAENIENLNEGFNYYLKQTGTKSEDDIKRSILNQYGTTIDGKPVYPEYNDTIHFSKVDFEPDFGLPIIMGTDFGRTPATVIGQQRMNGQIRWFEEVISNDMGITQFAQEVLKPLLMNRYRLYGGTRIINFCDPAGADPGQIDEVTCIQTLNKLGIYSIPCPVLKNSFLLRRECVASALRSMRDGEPAIVFGPRCPMIRKGFNGGYHYRRVMSRSGGDENYTNEPEKNEYSHPHDGLQYGTYGALHSGEDFSNPFGQAMSGSVSQIVGGMNLGAFGV